MKKIIRWGILGPGRIADKFARDLAVVPNAKLHAVASRSLEKAQNFAKLHHAPHAFGSYEALLDCPDLDVVYVSTPHTGHHPHTLLCLNRRIPVLCEKPIAINSTQTREMIALARQNQTFLMEALWTRFLPTIEKALTIVQEGTLGKVLSVKADFGFRPTFEPESRLYSLEFAGGALLDIGIYPVFLAHLFLGKPSKISALGVLGSTGVDEETGVILGYPDGEIAHIHTTIRSNTKTEAFVYCEFGTIYFHTRWYRPTAMSVLRPGHSPEFIGFEYPCEGFSYQITEVMRCLECGATESPGMPLDFSLDVMETLDEVRRQIGLTYPME